MGNVIEFRNITKYFPGVKALDDISFTANGGEVLALMGENGGMAAKFLQILCLLMSFFEQCHFQQQEDTIYR